MALLADQILHSWPWYFGVAAFAIWGLGTVGLTLLVWRRLRARAERRRDSQGSSRHTTRPGSIRDDRSLGSGKDLERW